MTRPFLNKYMVKTEEGPFNIGRARTTCAARVNHISELQLQLQLNFLNATPPSCYSSTTFTIMLPLRVARATARSALRTATRPYSSRSSLSHQAPQAWTPVPFITETIVSSQCADPRT